MALITFLSVIAALSGLVNAQCPISGCDGLRSFSSTTAGGSSLHPVRSSTGEERVRGGQGSDPQLLWSYESHRPSGAGCVTNGAGDSAVVICPMAVGQNVSVVSFAATNGTVLWSLSLTSQAVLPLVSIDGGSVVSDGQTLDWLNHNGRSLAPPVTLYPVQGLLFDLTITLSTSIVTMVYRCGFISTYTVDGVPISGLWLNDTHDGVEGTFIPLANPVMNDTHLYILSAFRAHAADKKEDQRGGKDDTTLLRLYAINVAAALDHKFTILWTYNMTVNGNIPYLHTNDTYCDSIPPGSHNDRGTGSSEKFPKQLGSPPGTLTMVGGRLLGAVSVENESGESISFNMSLRDLGKNYSVISSGYSNNLLTSFSWSNTNKEKWGTPPQKGNVPRGVEGEGFWASASLPGENRAMLELLLQLNGSPVDSSFLVLSSTLTTPVTLLQSPTEMTEETLLVFGAAGDVSGVGSPHLVGVVGGGGGRGGGGEGEGVPSVKWSVPLPDLQPAQGQISSLSISSRTLLFLTTPRGVYAYWLT